MRFTCLLTKNAPQDRAGRDDRDSFQCGQRGFSFVESFQDDDFGFAGVAPGQSACGFGDAEALYGFPACVLLLAEDDRKNIVSVEENDNGLLKIGNYGVQWVRRS